jgi:hypothetical protein
LAMFTQPFPQIPTSRMSQLCAFAATLTLRPMRREQT